MSIDNQIHANLDADEEWRARPDSVRVGDVYAFGLYFLLRIPDRETFEGCLSVGVTGLKTDHSRSVVLGYTGDSGARLTNVLLDAEYARQLARLLKKAARKVEGR